MRSSKWFLRKLVFGSSKIAKMDIIHYNNQAAISQLVNESKKLLKKVFKKTFPAVFIIFNVFNISTKKAEINIKIT
jgi:hypothetical protein